MKILVIASGSKGNCTYIETKKTKILIDAGINYIRIKNTLSNHNIDINYIDAILITHTHSDHIGGLSSLDKKLNIPIFAKSDLHEELKKFAKDGNINDIEENNIEIDDLRIDIINASHDVPSFGFIISNEEKKLFYLTDTGYINRKYYKPSENMDIYIIESNHDETMLMNGPYPYILKQRVISDKGHLSNRYTGKFLNKVIGNNTKYIVLSHISENNNTEDLALEQVKEELAENQYKSYKIITSKQNEETEMIII